MPKKQAVIPSEECLGLPSPRSRREELLDALLAHTTTAGYSRILQAYKDSGTVEGAEQEFSKIIQEIIDEA